MPISMGDYSFCLGTALQRLLMVPNKEKHRPPKLCDLELSTRHTAGLVLFIAYMFNCSNISSSSRKDLAFSGAMTNRIKFWLPSSICLYAKEMKKLCNLNMNLELQSTFPASKFIRLS